MWSPFSEDWVEAMHRLLEVLPGCQGVEQIESHVLFPGDPTASFTPSIWSHPYLRLALADPVLTDCVYFKGLVGGRTGVR